MHDLPVSHCLGCHAELDAATNVTGGIGPKSGDFTICLRCGHLMAFGDGLELRELTKAEAHAIAGDPRILAVQRARKAVK